ncbi:imidazolonepropionase, partial [Acinetobacter baumannii]
ELLGSAGKRGAALLRVGVTTLEVKSGDGLDAATEARMLRVARRLGDLGVAVRTTSRAAHALPPEFTDADAYIDAVCRWLPELHGQGLVDAVD